MLAPCVGYIAQEEYNTLCKQASKFLCENSSIQKALAEEMDLASSQLKLKKRLN